MDPDYSNNNNGSFNQSSLAGTATLLGASGSSTPHNSGQQNNPSKFQSNHTLSIAPNLSFVNSPGSRRRFNDNAPKLPLQGSVSANYDCNQSPSSNLSPSLTPGSETSDPFRFSLNGSQFSPSLSQQHSNASEFSYHNAPQASYLSFPLFLRKKFYRLIT